MSSLSVVIFAYNEEHNIGGVVEEADAVLRRIVTRYEVILVNDGSTDGTATVMRKVAAGNPNVRIITHPACQGIGASLKDGYSAARMEFVSFLPADGQIRATDLALLFEAVQDADVVTTFYTERPPSPFRTFLSYSVRVLLRVLFGGIPRYDGTYMFRRTVLDRIEVVSPTFVFNYEFVITAHKKGLKLREIGTVCLPRQSGASKVIGVGKIFRVFREIVKMRVRSF